MSPIIRPKQPPWTRPLANASFQPIRRLLARQIEIDPNYLAPSSINTNDDTDPIIDRSKGKGFPTEGFVLSIVMPILVVSLGIALAWLYWNRRRRKSQSDLPLFWELCGLMCGVRQHRDARGEVIKEGVKFDVRNYRWAGCCCIFCPVFLRSGKRGRDEIEMARLPALALGKKKGKFKKDKGKGKDKKDRDGDVGGFLIVDEPSRSDGMGLFLPGPSNYGGGDGGNGRTVIVEGPREQNGMKMPENTNVIETHHSGLTTVLAHQNNTHSSSRLDRNKNSNATQKREEPAGKARQNIPEVPSIFIRESTAAPLATPLAVYQAHSVKQTSNKIAVQGNSDAPVPKSKFKKEHRRWPSSGSMVEVSSKPKWTAAFRKSKTFTTTSKPQRKNSNLLNQSQSSTVPLTALDFIIAGPQQDDYKDAEKTKGPRRMGVIGFYSMKDIFKRKNHSNSIESIQSTPAAGPYVPKIDMTPALVHSASNQTEWVSICGGKGKRYVPPKPSIDSLKMAASRLARAAVSSVTSSPKSTQPKKDSLRGKKTGTGSGEYDEILFHRIEEEPMLPGEVQPLTTVSELCTDVLSTTGRLELDDTNSMATTARSKNSYASTCGYTTTTQGSALSVYQESVKSSIVSTAPSFIPVMDLGPLISCQTLSDSEKTSEFAGTEDLVEFKGSTLHAPPVGTSTPKGTSKARRTNLSVTSSKNDESLISTDIFEKDRSSFRSNPKIINRILSSVQQGRDSTPSQGNARRSSLLDNVHSPLFAVSATEGSTNGNQEINSISSQSVQRSASGRVSNTPTSIRNRSQLVVNTALANEGFHTSEDEDTVIPTSSINVEVSDTSRVTSKKGVRAPARYSSRYSTVISPVGSPYNRRNSSTSRKRSVSAHSLSTSKSSIITSNSGNATGLHELLLPGVVKSESVRKLSFSPRSASPVIFESKLCCPSYGVSSETSGGYTTETTYPSTSSEGNKRAISPEIPRSNRPATSSRHTCSRQVASPITPRSVGRASWTQSTEASRARALPHKNSVTLLEPLIPDNKKVTAPCSEVNVHVLYKENIRRLQESFDSLLSHNHNVHDAFATTSVNDDSLSRDLRAKVASPTPSEDISVNARRRDRASTSLPLADEKRITELTLAKAESNEGYVAAAKSPTKIPVRVSREIDRLNSRKERVFGRLGEVAE